MVHPSLVCNNLELVEKDPGSSLPPIRLQRSGQRTLLLQLDQKLELSCEHRHPIQLEANRRMFPLLNPQASGATRCCDYVLFSQKTAESSEGGLTVLLCELKSSRINSAFKQIQNASILVDHLLKLVEHHQARKCPTIDWRGVVFSERSTKKEERGRLLCRYQAAEFPVGTGGYATLKADDYRLSYLCG
jgi:hypothetical protein